MPFLARLAVDPQVPQRDEIVLMLAVMAIGYDEAYLPASLYAGRPRLPWPGSAWPIPMCSARWLRPAKTRRCPGRDRRCTSWDGNLKGYAAQALAALDGHLPADVMDGALRGLARSEQVAAFPMTSATLRLAFPRRGARSAPSAR